MIKGSKIHMMGEERRYVLSMEKREWHRRHI